MFNLSTQDVVSSIEKTPLVNLDGIYFQEYKNFFGNNLLEHFSDLENLDYIPLPNQEDKPRMMVAYSEKIMKELTVFFMHSTITKSLSKKFGIDLKFASVDVWRDGKGYNLTPHTDDKRVKLAVQIYLGEDSLGTSLFAMDKKTTIKTFEYTKDCGYALLNNERSVHGLDGVVKNDGRLSLYARYR